MNDRRLRTFMMAATVVGLLTGCGASNGQLKPVFIPPPPAKPRLQLLARFGSEAQLSGGSFLSDSLLGRRDDGGASFSKPYGSVMRGGKLYVTDTGLGSMIIVNFAKKRFEHLKGEGGPGVLKVPVNPAFDEQGNLYITDTGREAILVYDPDGNFLRLIRPAKKTRPAAIAVRGGRIYISDMANHQIVTLDLEGKELSRFGSAGRGPGQMSFPSGLALDKEGNIFVSEALNGRVQKFSPDGKRLQQIGRLGNRMGEMVRPKGVAIDPEGNLWVVDAATEYCQVFDKQGRLLIFFGGNKNKPDSLYLPSSVSITNAPENIAAFKDKIAPGFVVDFIVVIVSQYGATRISVFGVGHPA